MDDESNSTPTASAMLSMKLNKLAMTRCHRPAVQKNNRRNDRSASRGMAKDEFSRSLSSSGVQPDAILVGQYEWRALMFVRRVRAGFTPAVRASVFKKIRRLETTTRRFKNLPEARRASCRFPRRWSQAFALLLIRVTTRTSPQPGAARGELVEIGQGKTWSAPAPGSWLCRGRGISLW